MKLKAVSEMTIETMEERNARSRRVRIRIANSDLGLIPSDYAIAGRTLQNSLRRLASLETLVTALIICENIWRRAREET
jgi:hypothetical protein